MGLLYILVGLIAVTIATSDYNLSIDLNKEESYHYKTTIFGLSRFEINSTETVNIYFEHGPFIDRCINTTCCIKEYGYGCRDGIAMDVTITSNANDNYITIYKTEEIGCTWIQVNWFWLTSILVPVSLLCFAILISCLCCGRYRKIDNNSEMKPLI